EEDRCRFELVATPARALVEQLRSGDAHEQDRKIAREFGDVFDQVEERRLGPVDVIYDDDERPCSRECLEQSAHGPQALLALASSRAAEPERVAKALDDQLGLLPPGEPRRDRRRGLLAGIPPLCARNLSDNLGQRPVGDALAVREAAAAQDRHVAGEPAPGLPPQARLA